MVDNDNKRMDLLSSQSNPVVNRIPDIAIPAKISATAVTRFAGRANFRKIRYFA
jgi:hypothetical protein